MFFISERDAIQIFSVTAFTKKCINKFAPQNISCWLKEDVFWIIQEIYKPQKSDNAMISPGLLATNIIHIYKGIKVKQMCQILTVLFKLSEHKPCSDV